MKFIFVHIPKCGGNSIKKAFADSIIGTNITFHNVGHMNLNYYIQNFQSYVTDESSKDVLFFTIVRNPYDRFISAYYHAIKDGSISMDMLTFFKKFITGDRCVNATSSDEYKQLFWSYDEWYLYASTPQTEHTCKIFKLENLEEMVDYFKKEYNLDLVIDKINRGSANNTTSAYDVKTILNDELIGLINNYYNNDFVKHGYWKIRV